MAIVAEMGRPPAEPLSDGTAELTLELYVFGAMLSTVFNPCADTFGGALATDEVLLLVILRLILLLCVYNAIFQTAEICLFAFEALVVCTFEDGEPLKVVEKPALRL